MERNNMMMVKNSQMLYRAKHRAKKSHKKGCNNNELKLHNTIQYIAYILGETVDGHLETATLFFRENEKNSTYDTSRKLATIYGRESWVVFT